MSAPFVTELDRSLEERLRVDLLAQGFELSKPAHTLFAARKEGVSCTFYESGKLVVQGKDMASFIEFYLEPEILGSFGFTHAELDLTPRIGCDEAGKGDFFGPLTVAGVYANEEQIQALAKLGVADSKKLADSRIQTLARSIRSLCTHHVIALKPEKYNELYESFKNLNVMLAWAHATVIEQLAKQTGCQQVIVDQFANNGVLDRAVERKKIAVTLIQRVRGEADIVVAAASILARDAFVSGIARLGEMYGLELPKGAGPQVLAIARQVIGKQGDAMLRHIAKLHFKTRDQL